MSIVDSHKLTLLLISLLCLQILACSKWKSEPPADPTDSLLANPLAPALEAPPTDISSADNLPAVPASLEHRWVVSASEAVQLIEQGATLLDARGKGLIHKKMPGAIAVNWRDFSPRDAVTRGRLLADDAQLTQQLQALGVSQSVPVVVFGNPPGGWGEEGRIVWMLRTLGHRQAVLVDGGLQALVEVGVTPPSSTRNTTRPLGDFVVQRDTTWDIQQDALRSQLGSENLVIIDTREPREFDGKTPYGEQRGGHIPGAVHLYFKDLLGENGRLLPQQEIIAKLQTLGITPDMDVVVYCTGGIRSGWVASVLVSLGFAAKNYAGSMWEWSAAAAEQYPLE